MRNCLFKSFVHRPLVSVVGVAFLFALGDCKPENLTATPTASIENAVREIKINEDGTSTAVQSEVILLSDDSAVRYLKRQRFHYDSRSQSLQVIIAYTQKPNGEKILVKSEDISDLPVSSSSKFGAQPSARTVDVSFSNVAPGDRLVLNLERRTLLAPNSGRFVDLQTPPPLPVKVLTLRYSIPKSFKIESDSNGFTKVDREEFSANNIYEWNYSSDSLSHGKSKLERLPVKSPRLAVTAFSPSITLTRQKKSVSSWIDRNLLPLNKTNEEYNRDAFRRFMPVLAQTNVIGLGEATHGSKEFFQLKSDLVKFLITDMDFRIFALESSGHGAEIVNDYVAGGSSTRANALQGLGMQIWQTKEIAELIEWIRLYNSSVSASKKVQFVGIDMQDMNGADKVVKYLKTVDEDKSDALLTTLSEIRSLSVTGSLHADNRQADKMRILKVIDYFLQYMLEKKDSFMAESSTVEFDETIYRLKNLRQYVVGSNGGARDRAMADNVLHYASSGGRNARVMVWAHNAHIAVSDVSSSSSMGKKLRQALGQQYFALGLLFSRGSFKASARAQNGSWFLDDFVVGDAGRDSANWMLAQSQTAQYLLNLRALPKEGLVADWFKSEVPLLSAGGYGISPLFASRWFLGIGDLQCLSCSFDGIAFIKSSSSSTPLQDVDYAVR